MSHVHVCSAPSNLGLARSRGPLYMYNMCGPAFAPLPGSRVPRRRAFPISASSFLRFARSRARLLFLLFRFRTYRPLMPRRAPQALDN